MTLFNTDIHSFMGAEGLEATEATVLAKLIEQWSAVQSRNRLRTLYLEGESSLKHLGKLGMAIPPELGKLEIVMGWPSKAIDVLDARLDLLGFVLADQAEADDELEEIATDNDLYVESSLTHVASMAHGVAFATISLGDTAIGEPEVIIATRDATEASALWSPRSRRIIAGMTLNPGVENIESPELVLWLDDRILRLWKEGTTIKIDRQYHVLGQVPMVMLPYRPRLGKRYGISRISRPLMDLVDSAARTILRMEGTAEFFSLPQRWAINVEQEDFDDGFKTYLNRMLALGPREDGGAKPEFGTFSAQSPAPHIEQLRAIAMLVSGETSIPPNYLGIIQDNPASADAIRAAESDLVKIAERAQKTYGTAWSTIMRIAQHLRDGTPDPRYRHLKAQWRDASTPTKAADAQSVMTLVGAGVLPAQSEVTWELLGYDPVTISRLKADTTHTTWNSALSPQDENPIAPGGNSIATSLADSPREAPEFVP